MSRQSDELRVGARAEPPDGADSATQCTPPTAAHRPFGRGRRLVACTAVTVLFVAGVVAGDVGTVLGREPDATVAPGLSERSGPAPRDKSPGSVSGPSPRATSSPSTGTQRGRTRKIIIKSHGPGSFDSARLTVKPIGNRGKLLRYQVKVEKGLPFEADEVARRISTILNDPRSWSGSGDWRFELVRSSRKADLTLYVATPDTTDRLCLPYWTRGEVSCQNGRRVVLNARRWAFGAPPSRMSVSRYRAYLVNHEVGHALGRQHVGCRGKGRRASVMMQQTKGLNGCRPNPWPSPIR